MATKIFITGTTGYIGGDVFAALQKAHPEYEYTAIVRNSDKGALVAAAYPKTRLVYGTAEGAALIEQESAQADIVIHTADSADNTPFAKAIIKGITEGHSSENPGYYIHVSGTGILTWHNVESKAYGEAPTEPVYDDWEGVSALTSLPDVAFHRDVDKLVLAASSDSVKTAIVCPPTIYGLGRGPDNTRSQQVYKLAQVTLETGVAPQLGKGLTEWNNVHVHDLSNLFVLLVEAAIASKSAGGSREGDDDIWGAKGYFLAENGTHVWGEVSKLVGGEAFGKGYIKTKDVKVLAFQEVRDLGGSATWGLNSLGISKRARKVLGWKPSLTLEDEISTIVDSEAKRLGIVKGHAEKAAGGK